MNQVYKVRKKYPKRDYSCPACGTELLHLGLYKKIYCPVCGCPVGRILQPNPRI